VAGWQLRHAGADSDKTDYRLALSYRWRVKCTQSARDAFYFLNLNLNFGAFGYDARESAQEEMPFHTKSQLVWDSENYPKMESVRPVCQQSPVTRSHPK
jgi:hypothetical protein